MQGNVPRYSKPAVSCKVGINLRQCTMACAWCTATACASLYKPQCRAATPAKVCSQPLTVAACCFCLTALMQDQVAAFQAHGVNADYLSSTRTAAERRALLAQLTPAAAAAAATAAAGSNGNGSDRLALLYVTPELLATDRWADPVYGGCSRDMPPSTPVCSLSPTAPASNGCGRLSQCLSAAEMPETSR
jgi:hypothetical protein